MAIHSDVLGDNQEPKPLFHFYNRPSTRRIQQTFRQESRTKAQQAFEETPIVVYSKGKDGSSTVYESLRCAGYSDRVFHVHVLDGKRFASSRRGYQADGVMIPRVLHESEALLEQMRSKPNHPIKVITLVRDPLARELSSLFQNVHRAGHILKNDGTVCVEKALDHLTTESSLGTPCQTFFEWFDAEPKRVLGIDILATPFPQDRGWNVYRQGRIEMLLIRLEDLSRIGSEVLADFLDAPSPIPIQNSNVTHNEAYPLVKKSWKITLETCQQIYNSPVMRHLYSEEQRAEMIQRWALGEETAAEVDHRIRGALQRDAVARRVWEKAKRTQLISWCADQSEREEASRHKIRELRRQVTELTNRMGAVRILSARNDRLLSQLIKLAGSKSESTVQEGSRPGTLPFPEQDESSQSPVDRMTDRPAANRRVA